MSDVDRYFHEVWLGMVQPVDGLVVSVPVLVDAQCMERLPPVVQERLIALCPPTRQGEAGAEGFTIASLPAFLSEMLGLGPDLFDAGSALPDDVSLYVAEGKQTITPTLALKKQGAHESSPYEALVWELPVGLDLDKPESVTGTWDYPPSAKFDRLLRHARVPIGLLTNREAVRLVYAPHGESSGSITFRIEDMASVGGRPILDAFVMLLSANRFFGVSADRALPAILVESRKRQANVTNALADQVFEALQVLLRGFEAAAERDGSALLDEALGREEDHLYKGLLAVLLRLVFVLYAEDRGLLPVEHRLYQHLSVLRLFEELQADRGAYPDSMPRRFGAWGRLVALFRAVYLGLDHGDLKMPARRGLLFDPHEYPFLEGWGPGGSAPITQAEDRAAVRLPTVDDETVFRVLEKLLLLDGQRLSYRALDVEQIGSVYEALMGYHVERVSAPAVCLKPHRLWITAEEVLETPPARRAKWIKETVGLSAAQAERVCAEIDSKPALEALAAFAVGGRNADPALSRARVGQLVIQPGSERRRTSSHYTPRSLSAPIVERTLEPLLAVMGKEPASERILNLKVCDPAMGSGAFLVEACRYLADQLLLAWTREGKVEAFAAEHGDPLLHARRVVAQRCLYGVDKNAAAVELAKLSLWLLTISKTLPFTFLDHSLRHGDSLVGLDFDQIRAFHWKRPPKEGEREAPKQLELFGREIAMALDEAISLRQHISELTDSAIDDKEKARLFWDAQDALERVRLIGDVIVGAFFAHEKDKDRERERANRENLVRNWLVSGGPPTEELLTMQREMRGRLPVFHWMVEFPEVFYAERPDPLEDGEVNRAAYMDAFVGNPPFAGKNAVSVLDGEAYIRWLQAVHDDSHGNADIVAHFFRRCHGLIGHHGTFGLIATNTIAQGDTRAAGLQYLLRSGDVIYEAKREMKWPGTANVSVAVVHIGRGAPVRQVCVSLDGVAVASIDSRLRGAVEREDALEIADMKGFWSNGTYPHGEGFVLTTGERESLVAHREANRAVTPLFIGGEEVNTRPDLSAERHIINFARRDLREAESWPELLGILTERVKPARDALRATSPAGAHRKKYWWQLSEPRPELYEAIGPLERCLVNAQVSKHLMFAFQPTDRMFAITLYVYPLDAFSSFATLQSRIHEPWARLLSSSMRNDLRYSASDCFETFPFPQPDPRTVIPALEDIGQRLYDTRAKYMVDENVGLTITYNRLKDPAWTEVRILELRALHEEMDRAVLQAYAEGDPDGRWDAVEVPPFCPLDEADKKKLEAFEDAVIDRLFALNAKRAAEEKAAAQLNAPAATKKAIKATKTKKAPKASSAKAKAASATAAKKPRPKKLASETLALGPAPAPSPETEEDP